jgi:histidinol-phosphatase (PHP family)
MEKALKSGCVFEVNTGAISRGYRTAPYPNELWLHFMKKQDAKLILTSDCHSADALDCHFEETKKLLSDIGFTHLYTIYHNEWVKYEI